MQTFLPYPLYQDSVKCLDNKRLGKQRVECMQLLKALSTGGIQNSLTPQRGFKYVNGLYQRKTPWYNHPAAQMWKGFEGQLAIYGLHVCNEWIKRGFKDTCFDKIHKFIPEYAFSENHHIDYSGHSARLYPIPKWFSDNNLFSSHRANLLRKDPVWYGQFGWTESPDMPYVWPVNSP